ncbi:MAG: CPBP family intramembrane glutamic endopeptidase [Anaerolineaceae bacterium]
MDNQSPFQKNSVLLFFIITFAFSWLLGVWAVLDSLKIIVLPFPPIILTALAMHGPLVAALFLIHKSGGWQGVRAYLRSGFNFRMRPVWWFVILLLPAALFGLALWLNISLNGFQPDTALLSRPWMIPVTFVALFFLGGSFQEEFGWRGYALPRLMEKQSPLAASLILGSVWAVWHLPLFFMPNLSQSYMPFGIFFLLTIGFSMVFTWIYHRTGRNLFSALLLHTAINTSASLFPPIELKAGVAQTGLVYLMAFFLLASAVLIVKERGFWFKRVGIENVPA